METWDNGEYRQGTAYPEYPPTGDIQVIIPGMNDNELCQYGECEGCGTTIGSNRKYIYCPNCGKTVGCT